MGRMVCEIDVLGHYCTRTIVVVGMSTGLVLFSSCSLPCDRTCSAEIPTRDHPSVKELEDQVTMPSV